MTETLKTYDWLLVDAALVLGPALLATAAIFALVAGLRLLARRSIRAGARAWGRLTAPRARKLAPLPMDRRPGRVGVETAASRQWTRVNDAAAAGIARGRAAGRRHASAAVQLDAALYALRDLNRGLASLAASGAAAPAASPEYGAVQARPAKPAVAKGNDRALAA